MARPLTRREAQALVDRRLAALGHGGDFVSQEALEELLARAGHAAGAFGAALGAVLFLAATEDVERIERGLVVEAVPAGDASMAPAEPRSWLWMGIVASLCIVFAGAGLAWKLLLTVPQTPVIAVPKPQSSPATSPSGAAVTIVLPPVYVSPPLPALPAFDLPIAPPARISLMAPAGDRATLASFTDLGDTLRRAGFADVGVATFNSAKIQIGAMRNHVVYYFKEDAQLAENVAAALDSAEASDHIRNHWVPVLVVGHAGITAHPPGSIDVFGP